MFLLPPRNNNSYSFLPVYNNNTNNNLSNFLKLILFSGYLGSNNTILKDLLLLYSLNTGCNTLSVPEVISNKMYYLVVPVWLFSNNNLKKNNNWILNSYVFNKFSTFFSSPLFGFTYLFSILKLSWTYLYSSNRNGHNSLSSTFSLFSYYLIFKFENMPATVVNRGVLGLL